MNRYKLYAVIIVIFFITKTYSQSIYNEILSDRTANYTINVELDDASKILTGDLILEWTNQSPDSVSELQFHMYLNAFKNSKSTFMKESGGTLRGLGIVDIQNMWGWIDIISMKIKDGELLTSKIKYIQPDDSNSDDQTVISVPLSKAVKPGETIKIEIDFLAKIPQIIARTGYSDNYFFIGQWFPKIGVLEYKGIRNATSTQWNCHQYHALSEFYSDFGVYKVNITVPDNYFVGATGLLFERKDNKDGTRTHYFVAEDVIDFAWAASPDFVEYEKVSNGTVIKALMQPEHADLAFRHLNAAILALNFFEENLGEYPYPNITIIDPPFKALESGGMEYPTLITTVSFAYTPFSVKIPEMTTIHEFGHNYFMAVIASNEFEEPWLDEGLNSYFEAKIMEENYPVVSFLGYNIEDFEYHRTSYSLYFNPQIIDIDNFAWDFPLGSYSVMNYNKSAIIIKTIENLVGEDVMKTIMQTYYDRWKFKHPCTNDFIDIVNEIVKKEKNDLGKNMNWFFQQTIFNSAICDYKLASINNEPTTNENSGVFDKEGVKLTVFPESEEVIYNSNIVIYRLGDVKMPVEILVHFENGDEIVEKWDGEENLKTFYYSGAYKIEWAKVDYLDKLLIDINRNNNSLTLNENKVVYAKYSNKFMFLLQNILQTIGFLV